MKTLLAIAAAAAFAASAAAESAPIKTLVIDGQNNHGWRATTPVIKQILEETKLFKVDVATAPDAPKAPPKPKDKEPTDEQKAKYERAVAEYKAARAAYETAMAQFKPKFSDYGLVVSNYNGERWPAETEAAFAEFVKAGGGFVAVHAANNSFPDWPEYNAMIGVGGWGGRNEKSGPYIRFKEGHFVRDESKGSGGSHGRQHPFLVEIRTKDHPIVAGLPEKWLHAQDELYDRLRGPAKNLTVLATAYADPKTGGSGEHEPQLLVIEYGKGRVFHTTLGHSVEAMKCVGFQATLTRGGEWAATGKVTQKAPADFPTAEKVSARP